MADPDCIFCKILAGELPAQIVDEDERTIAFMDIAPAAQRLAGRMGERLRADGVNLLNACGPAAWQTVFHFHVHVIPRYDDDPLQVPTRPQQADDDELRALAEQRG